MRVGILTYFAVPNYGAMLQALALWKKLESRGHEVVFFDCPLCAPCALPLWRCLISRHWSQIVSRLKNRLRLDCVRFANFYPRTKRNFDLSDFRECSKDLDMIIVGSDQMWNPTWLGSYLPVVFLSFAPDGCKIISYAASFGVRAWPECCKKGVSGWLKRFEAISVREESAVQLVKALSDKEADLITDPTMLWGREFYEKYINDSKRYSSKYLFSFMLDEWSDGVKENELSVTIGNSLGITKIEKASSYGSFPLSILYKTLGIRGKKSLEQWLILIRDSAFVITNSFHGVVFSIIFHKPFIALLHGENGNEMNDRLTTLLKSIGLNERACYVNDVDCAHQIAQQVVHWDVVDSKIDLLRKKAESFMRKVDL